MVNRINMNIISKNLNRYKKALEQLPAPGYGNGCHGTLLSIANLGAFAGLLPETIFDDIRAAIPQGQRKISDREIVDAINKALTGYHNGSFTPKPKTKPIVRDGKAALQKIIEQSDISDEADLKELSPIRLPEAV